jgi:putative membrane protein
VRLRHDAGRWKEKAVTSWALEPGVPTLLAAGGILYGRGLKHHRPQALPRGGPASFYLGLVVLGAALLSPLAVLSQQMLSAHMIQHLALMLVAPPLILYARPGLVMGWGMSAGLRRRVMKLGHTGRLASAFKAVRHPVTVSALAAGALWGWHLPLAYQAALKSYPLNALEHLSFVGTSLLLWALVIGAGRIGRKGYPQAMACLFANGLAGAALGAILIFSPALIYPVYASSGLPNPLRDQQLAGAIMWVPPGIVYLATLTLLAFRWLSSFEQAKEQHPAAAEGAAG